MGFYHTIRDAFGIETMKLMKQWASFNIKLANQLNRKHFLLRCRRMHIFPYHIQNNTKNVRNLLVTMNWRLNQEITRFNRRLDNKILNLEISICYSNISKIKTCIHNLKSIVSNTIPLNIFNEYEHRLSISFQKSFNKVKSDNVLKFNKLLSLSGNSVKYFGNNSKWFKNVSNIDIPKDIADFLSLGPKFGVHEGNGFNVEQFIADVECILGDVPSEQANIMRAKITNNLTNFMINNRSKEGDHSITQLFYRTKRFLKSNPDICILRADKGGCTVAMSRDEYFRKVEHLLQDESTYQLLHKDPTYKTQKSHNDLIKRIKNKNEIDEISAKKLTVYNSVPAKLYALPKIHKQDVPLRPIVSSINSTTYDLSKFLSNILTNTFSKETNYNIKDTFSFVNAMSNVRLPPGFVLVSLDVVSLFTTIPITLVEHILDIRWELIQPNTGLSKDSFFLLFRFVMNSCYFTFNGKFYQQIFGTPMGSPISPILALIVMDHLLDAVIPRLPFQLPFIYKYVDDIICAIPERSGDVTLSTFNSFHNDIKFTMETETSGTVPFLDTCLVRLSDNSVILNWYQKPSASGRYINYQSNHPLNHKYNTVIAMKNRVKHISDDRFLKDNLEKLFKMFLNNGYPANLLNKLIYSSNSFDGPIDDGAPVIFNYKKLPYITNLTNNVINHFKDLKDLKIAKYNSLNIGHLFTNLKDSTPKMSLSNVVYKIPCNVCQRSYIGQSSQTLKNRITQHKSDCRIGKNSCALVDHYQKFNHHFNFNETSVLQIENNYKKRLVYEMLHIASCKEAVNFKSDTSQLSSIYCNILNF